jgi:SAM-dependent methyltransferase
MTSEDRVFDAIYGSTIRGLSKRFWTPVGVARRAAQLFHRAGARSVLDVGSGAGKFVLVAAAEAPEVTFSGIEQRPHLVRVARHALARLRLPNVRLSVGDGSRAPWTGYDGLYFFNPFVENLFDAGEAMDWTVELSRERFFGDVLRVERALRAAPAGTLLVTYHGLSGRVPACYELCTNERAGSDWLRLWRRRVEAREGFFVECGDEVSLHPPDGSPA